MDIIQTRIPQFTLRMATLDDAALVVSYMKRLGEFQKMADKITEADIRRLLNEKRGEVIFGEYAGATVGYIYFYQNSDGRRAQHGIAGLI